jgi:hypothetical protein
MNIKSQTMRMVLQAMSEAEDFWQRSGRPEDEMINPDAPVIIQLGDFAYEISSVGGDMDIDGFVICLKDMPVGEWRGLEYMKINGEAK